MLRYVALFGTIILMVIGQLMLKSVAASSESVISAIRQPSLYIGLGVYGLATISWIVSLRLWPLSIAYPAQALAIFIVVLIAVFWMGERLSVVQITGLAGILGGLVLLAFG